MFSIFQSIPANFSFFLNPQSWIPNPQFPNPPISNFKCSIEHFIPNWSFCLLVLYCLYRCVASLCCGRRLMLGSTMTSCWWTTRTRRCLAAAMATSTSTLGSSPVWALAGTRYGWPNVWLTPLLCTLLSRSPFQPTPTLLWLTRNKRWPYEISLPILFTLSLSSLVSIYKHIYIYIYLFVPLFLRFSCSCTTTTKSLDTEHSFPTQTWSVGLMTRDLSQWSVFFIRRLFLKNFLVSDDPSEHERPFGLEDTSGPLYRNSPQNHPLHFPGSSWPLGFSSSRPRGPADLKFQHTYRHMFKETIIQ